MRFQIPNFLTFPTSSFNVNVTLYRDFSITDLEFDPNNGRPITIVTYSGQATGDGVQHVLTRKYTSPREYVDSGPFPPILDAPAAVINAPHVDNPDENEMLPPVVEYPGPSRPVPRVDITDTGNYPAESKQQLETRIIDDKAAQKNKRSSLKRPDDVKKETPRNLKKVAQKRKRTEEIEFRHINARIGDSWTIASEELKKVGRAPDAAEDEVYYIEKIVDVRFRTEPEYLVKWYGWSNEFNSWESEDKFSSKDTLINYMKEREKEIKKMLQEKVNDD